MILLALFLLSPLRLLGDVTNCASGTHLESEQRTLAQINADRQAQGQEPINYYINNWSVKVNDPAKAESWLGDNHKIVQIHNPASGTNREDVYLKHDVSINDRVYIGSSGSGGVSPTGNARLYITNTGAGHAVTIFQRIWGSRTSGSGHSQTVDNNCMFTVWGSGELIIEGESEQNPIIIDGG
ncbi:MAG: hypothetical protein ACI4SO_00985, partial [Muribaculaceae bacterium]